MRRFVLCCLLLASAVAEGRVKTVYGAPGAEAPATAPAAPEETAPVAPAPAAPAPAAKPLPPPPATPLTPAPVTLDPEAPPPPPPAPPGLALDALEYQIIAAVLKHGLEPGQSHVVFAETTVPGPGRLVKNAEEVAKVAKQLEVPPELLDDWAVRNAKPARLKTGQGLGVAYELVGFEEQRRLFSSTDPAAGWAAFHQRFPQAPLLIRVSRAGFDAGLTHALVYVEFECGAECGSGRLVTLVRAPGGGYTVKDGALIWMTSP